jgi:hypothetical protein
MTIGKLVYANSVYKFSRKDICYRKALRKIRETPVSVKDTGVSLEENISRQK